MMEELLYNLCDNAIRYNKADGSVKVILKNEEDVADAMAETVLTCWEKLTTLKKIFVCILKT